MRYQLTECLQLAGKPGPSIRTVIEADSPADADAKFRAFLLRKATPVVQACRPAEPSISEVFEWLKNMWK